jgi:hypothetical protein
MGMIAVTAIVDYLLHIATKENKLPFSVSIAANKGNFAVSVFGLQQQTEVCRILETWRQTWRHEYMETPG